MGIAVAVYTGVLLGAMPARPFWNSPILAMLFLRASALGDPTKVRDHMIVIGGGNVAVDAALVGVGFLWVDCSAVGEVWE